MAVAVVFHRLELVEQSAARPLRRFAVHPQFEGDGVGGKEAEAEDVSAESVWVALDYRYRLVAVCAVDAGGLSHAYAVRLQEDHHVPDALLGLPGLLDHVAPLLADPIDLHQAAWLVFDHVERVGAELIDNPLRVDFADAADQAAGQETANALDGCGRDADDGLGPELESEAAVVHPAPGGGEFLADPDRGARADDRDRSSRPVGGLDGTNHVARVLVAEGYLLDGAVENRLVSECLLGNHTGYDYTKIRFLHRAGVF